jgi:enoyl-CoA hydratase/carnithine racemase
MNVQPETNSPFVLYRPEGRIATITLNRPERLNAMDHGPGSTQRAVVDALEAADRDDSIRCVVITGSGRAFSSGGDLGQSSGLQSAVDWYWFLGEEDYDNERIRTLRKPVIGAINGLCYGAALIMAAHFDFLIAVEGARFGLIETRYGGTGVDVLTYLVGPQWARFLALTGEIISAERAKEIGLVLEVFAPDVFEAKVYDLARRIAAMPPATTQLNRRVITGATKMMGWGMQKDLALAVNAVTNSVGREQTASDGRNFSELLKESWSVFKDARDEPFREPWLEG